MIAAMPRAKPRELVIPALLTVSVLTITTACGDGGSSGSSGTTSTASGSGGSGGGGGAGGRGGGGGAGGAGGNPYDELPCSYRYNKKDCLAMSIHACSWAAPACSTDCTAHMDPPSCAADVPCEWVGGQCEAPV